MDKLAHQASGYPLPTNRTPPQTQQTHPRTDTYYRRLHGSRLREDWASLRVSGHGGAAQWNRRRVVLQRYAA